MWKYILTTIIAGAVGVCVGELITRRAVLAGKFPSGYVVRPSADRAS